MNRLICVILLSAFSLLTSTRAAAPGPRRSDAEIESTIKVKLAKSKIGKDGFQVHVKNGIATWTGSTSVIQHKGAATRMAKTAGALQVVNNIKISDEARAKASGNFSAPRKVEVKSGAN